MTLEEIEAEWAKDAQIDRSELGEESLRGPQLHQKYWKILARERLRLRKLESDLAVLKLEVAEFLTLGPNEDTEKKGWRLPPRGKILDKTMVSSYVSAFPAVVELALKVSVAHEKTSLAESIVKSVMGRHWEVGRAIEWEKLVGGR